MRVSVIFKVIYVVQGENRCPMGLLSIHGLSASGDFFFQENLVISMLRAWAYPVAGLIYYHAGVVPR